MDYRESDPRFSAVKRKLMEMVGGIVDEHSAYDIDLIVGEILTALDRESPTPEGSSK